MKFLLHFILLLFVLHSHADNVESEKENHTVESNEQAVLTLSNYETLLQQIEAERGVYDEENAEILISIGQLHQEIGQHVNAVNAFEKAIQNIKVNNGLYSQQQLDVLELLIESNLVLNDEQALRKNYAYLFWVYKRNYANDVGSLLPVIKRVGKWYFDLYNLSLPGTNLEPLIAADELYDEVLELEFTETQLDDKAALLYSRAVVNYRLAEEVIDHKFSHREIREAMMAHKRSSPYVNEIAVRQYFFDQSFFKARRAIRNIIELYEDKLPEKTVEYAQALVFLADWHNALKRTWGTDKYYKQAYSVLVDNNAGDDVIKQIFGEPVPIENLPVPGEEEYQVDEANSYVDALVDVPVNGWPANIRILKITPATDNSLHKRAKRAISSVRYRPRYVNGEAVATSDVELRFVFKYKDAPGWFHF